MAQVSTCCRGKKVSIRVTLSLHFTMCSNIFHASLFSRLQKIEWVEISCKHSVSAAYCASWALTLRRTFWVELHDIFVSALCLSDETWFSTYMKGLSTTAFSPRLEFPFEHIFRSAANEKRANRKNFLIKTRERRSPLGHEFIIIRAWVGAAGRGGKGW